MSSANPDMTIRDISVTMLRMPWADDPWLKGHALGTQRDILICEVETAGGITGMGYLFLFRPGMKSIAACLEECIIPRVKGKDATSIEAIWRDLWTATMTYGRGGIAAMAMSALDIARWENAPAYRCTGCGVIIVRKFRFTAPAVSAAPAATA
jgi:L-alanine-DL-glutamate epimerase-like enolase superfamily enzyme